MSCSVYCSQNQVNIQHFRQKQNPPALVKTICKASGNVFHRCMCEHLQASPWWRWRAVGENGKKVPRWSAGEESEQEQELELQLGLELESVLGQEKREQQCGWQHCSGLHFHLHWLPEEAAGLMWLSVSVKIIQHREKLRHSSSNKMINNMERWSQTQVHEASLMYLSGWRTKQKQNEYL